LSSNDLDNKDWEVVKIQMLKPYGTQINTTAACKGISKLYLIGPYNISFESKPDYSENFAADLTC
jgi:hypothetical protein